MSIFILIIYFLGNIKYLRASNNSCFSLTLRDSFGDGWGPIELRVEPPDGRMISLMSGCSHPVVYNECARESGIYFFMITHPKGASTPQNIWEVRSQRHL